jgi:hypothetical protein
MGRALLCSLLILLLVFPGPPFWAGEAKAVRMRWTDAGELILGKRVAVMTVRGEVVKGLVRTVEPGAILLDKGSVSRPDITEIHLIEYAGNGRHIGKLVGGAVGLMGGLLGAAAYGLKEDAANKDRNKALSVLFAVAGLPAGLAAGWLLGRRADREVTLIRVIPEAEPMPGGPALRD